MSSDEPPQDVQQQSAEPDIAMQDVAAEPTIPSKKRPRLDLTVSPRERKRGKSMFGIVLGTLNKAKIEDKERNASDAAKKRQLIEQRLQTKLRKETDSVRRAEEAKRDKTLANRKEEDLQLKDSVQKLRRTRLPLLANFLLTSDDIPTDDSPSLAPTKTPLTNPPLTHPPPIFYLPTILTPAQETFLAARKNEVKEAAEAEWLAFREERTAGIQEIHQLRERVAEEEARKQSERAHEKESANVDQDMGTTETEAKSAPPAEEAAKPTEDSKPGEMEVDDVQQRPVQDEAKEERKDEPAVDDDDAVEY